MQSLVARGLSGLELIVSDAHAGLKQARKAVFGGIPGNAANSTCNKMLRDISPDKT